MKYLSGATMEEIIRMLVIMRRTGIEAGQAGIRLREEFRKIFNKKGGKMKVNFDRAWRPLTITLETEEEFRALRGLVFAGLRSDETTVSNIIYAKLESVRQMLDREI